MTTAQRPTAADPARGPQTAGEAKRPLRLFLCGDVMTGRGVDQILPHPGRPEIFESFLRSAVDYVLLAEAASGAISRPVGYEYVWGDALAELAARSPEARIVNLETAVTAGGDPWPGKGIHYRMHPGNVECLRAAGLDCCVLANNHVLDWGHTGLRETLGTLASAGLATAGAGRDEREARSPAVIGLPGGGRLLVFAFALPSSGVPESWAAAPARPGVWLLADTSRAAIESLANAILAHRRPGDVVVASVHWGGNWGYQIPAEHRRLAHGLVDAGAVDLVHGHSSHHPLAVEVYRGRLVIYGCGDFLNDYEGISGYESYRPDLSLMYLPELDRGCGALTRLDLVPMQIRHLRTNRASTADTRWLAARMSRECRPFGAGFSVAPDGTLQGHWTQG